MSAASVPAILLIDDSEEDVDLLSIQLKQNGLAFTLSVCENTDRASQFIAGCRSADDAPDLIVLDLHLPPKNGEAVFRAIRNSPALAQTPVLIMTTSASPVELETFRTQPNTRVATKPYALSEYGAVLNIIRALLKVEPSHA
jgi:CheY-like chemotaxis protein